jgi:hypothetical protein
MFDVQVRAAWQPLDGGPAPAAFYNVAICLSRALDP